MVHFHMAKDQTRRNFLRTAPLAVATLPLADKIAFAAEGAQTAAPEPYQVLPEEKFIESVKTLRAKPGNDNLFTSKTLPFSIVMTVEEKKSGAEFEYHEGRDHIFHILEGSTSYQLGGTPKNPRNTKPGEWLAPASEGASTVTLHKGDVLIIPRGTPHKRTTAESVTFTLTSIESPLKS
jgi:quercetin dioxygenase-like cupin family protein